MKVLFASQCLQLAPRRSQRMSAFAPLAGRVNRTFLTQSETDAADPNVWSGRALQENFFELDLIDDALHRWGPFPASLAGGAGARPDHPISGHSGELRGSAYRP